MDRIEVLLCLHFFFHFFLRTNTKAVIFIGVEKTQVENLWKTKMS